MESTTTQLLAANFPLCFENGHTIDALAFWCVKCGKTAQDSQVLGQLSKIVPDTADIRASYHCSCGYANTYRIRLKDDKSFMWLTDVGWRVQHPRRLSKVTAIRQWCLRTIGFLKIKWICFSIKQNLMKLCRLVSNNREQKR